MDLSVRPRRLRKDGIRETVRETSLSASDLVAPVFVDATADERQPIASMPGHERIPVDEIVARVTELLDLGIQSVIVFGVPESKDAEGSRAWTEDGVVQRALRRITTHTDAYAIADVCFCEYTDHGHCGVLADGAGSTGTSEDVDHLTVDNDATIDNLQRTAVSLAAAGADMVAPSGMIDGQVGAIRTALDDAGHEEVAIMSYAVKYHSAFYGPFRDAADGAPTFGDRRHYQMDTANAREALLESQLDADEGADVLMVKPALAYLDVLHRVRTTADRPVAAYNVSGTYAMVHAAADRNWIDLEETAAETLLSIKRAGADLILTYFAEDIASQL